MAFAVLSSGPGWNWTTMINLYDSLETYTWQLRSLESYVDRNPNDASAEFLLGYHYLVQDHTDAAAERFAKASELRPDDPLSAKFAKALMPQQTPPPPAPSLPSGEALPTSDVADDATTEADDAPVPPPPAQMVGIWTANPDADVSITLTLDEIGDYSWSVTEANRTQTIQGQAGFQDEILVLSQSEGPPLAGAVTLDDSANAFVFRPTGAPADVEGLAFERQSSH